MMRRALPAGVALAMTLPLLMGMGGPAMPMSEGRLAYQLGQYEKAHAIFAKAEPASVEARFWQGNAAYHLGRADEAIESWKVAAADPQVAKDANTQLGKAKEQLVGLTALLDKYATLRGGEPKSGDWRVLAGQFDEFARETANSLAARRASLLAADCVARAGDKADALARFEEVKDNHPLVADWALWRMAEVEPRRATEFLGLLMDRYPDSPMLHAAKVALAEATPDASRKRQLLADAVEHGAGHPASERALFLLSQIPNADRVKNLVRYWNAYPEGRFLDKVVYDLAKVPGLSADTNYRIASYMYFKSDYGPATTFFNKVRSPMALYRMGRSYWGLNDLNKAVATLNGVIKADRSLAGKAYLTIGQVEAQRGRWAQAIDAYHKATKYGGESGVTAQWKLSRIYRDQGKASQAAALERRIIQAYPWSEEATTILWNEFWGAYRARRFNDAIINGKRLAQHHPYHISGQAASYWLGRIYEQRGQHADALAVYRGLMGRSPAGYYGWRARWREQALAGKSQDPWFSTRPGRAVQEPPIRWHDLLSARERELMAGVKGTALPKEMLAWPESVRELLFLRQFDIADWFATGSRSPNLKAWMSFLQMRYRQSIREEKGEPRLAYPLGFAPLLTGAAGRHGVDPLLLAALVREESRFDPTAKSWVGATGLAQLMPFTAEWVFNHVPDVKGRPLTDPHTNLQLGAWYLAHTHKVFDGASMYAVAAYNGGPGAVSKWRRQYSVGGPDEFVEMIPYEETRHYVMKVFSSYWNYVKLYSGG